MPIITEHKVGALNEALIVTADDPSTLSGMSHVYQVSRQHFVKGEGAGALREALDQLYTFSFQNGPLKEAGEVNGISNEVLIAIVLDRLRGAQTSKYKCRENALAITKLEEGLHWLQARTRERIARGVEGTWNP